jgi:hypothetical protein
MVLSGTADVFRKKISHHAMRNPYFSLLATAWKYARQEKKRFVLVYGMFVLATTIVAINPLFYGWFVNELQAQGSGSFENGLALHRRFFRAAPAGVVFPWTGTRDRKAVSVHVKP